MTVTLWSGSIPEDALEIVQHRIERLARRADKQGFPVPTLSTGARGIRDYQGLTVRGIDITIEAAGPLRIGDWLFVGTISALADGSPFVTYAPGADRVDDDFATVNYCDHCRTIRDRNDTYIVRNGDGITKQVGSSCIKDFTGHSPAAIVGWLRAVEEVTLSEDEVDGWYRNATRFYPPVAIIGLSSRIVAKAGYVSRQKAMDEDKIATGDLVRNWLTARGKELAEFERDYPESDDARALYNATMAGVEQNTGSSEWASDIVRLARSEGVQWRHIGILASAVILGLRQQERKAVESLRPDSQFFGEVGQRINLTNVRVVLKRSFEGNYGTTFVIRMDVDGNDALWFASWSSVTEELNEGDIITLTATVKGHERDSRSDRPTTVLTRCTIRDVRAPEKE